MRTPEEVAEHIDANERVKTMTNKPEWQLEMLDVAEWNLKQATKIIEVLSKKLLPNDKLGAEEEIIENIKYIYENIEDDDFIKTIYSFRKALVVASAEKEAINVNKEIRQHDEHCGFCQGWKETNKEVKK